MNTTTGIIYRNPKPHVFSKHAYFPWLVKLNNGELLASFVLAQAFESKDANTYLSRSVDGGVTWSEPEPLLGNQEKSGMSNCARITETGTEVVAIMVRSDRTQHPEDGLANPLNLGFVSTEILLIRSKDGGHNWQEAEKIIPPLEGPSFEACSPVVMLTDGRWVWPTSTWRSWDGFCPNGMKMVAFESFDNGKTWPSYLDVMDGNMEKVIYWEGKIIQLRDGELLSMAWAYSEGEGRDLMNRFVLSRNGGKTWTKPASTGIQGQTAAMLCLSDNRVFVVYRRTDKPGLWGDLVEIKENEWINISSFCLWQGTDLKRKKGGNMVQEFNELKFGAPCILEIDPNDILISFWCYEGLVSNIRWIRIHL